MKCVDILVCFMHTKMSFLLFSFFFHFNIDHAIFFHLTSLSSITVPCSDPSLCGSNQKKQNTPLQNNISSPHCMYESFSFLFFYLSVV